jgi:hypothetical protein
MAYYGNNDKSEKGTPGLLFRERLEYGVGQRSLSGKWDLLWSMHSHQASLNPTDVGGEKPENCVYTLSELLIQNDKDLESYAELSVLNDADPLLLTKKIEYVKVLAACLKRIDEINTRGQLLEAVKAPQGAPMPS